MKKLTLILITFISLHSFGQATSNKELKKSLDKLFNGYTHYNRFTGNVLISKGDQIIYQKSVGYANIEKNKKNTKKSVFSIASLTKPLTAVGIMTLVENGKLTLETTLNTYFPNFIPKYSQKITIRHLLNHSSGMQANIGRIDDNGNGYMPGKTRIALPELFEKFKNTKLNFEPGKGYEYNNFGYTLLAYIIEKISKKSYAEYMNEAVFKPANMKNTTADNNKTLKRKAYPHTGLGFKEFRVFKNESHPSLVIGAGNIKSTTGDLYNFMNALESGKLLKSSSVNKLYSNTQEIGIEDSKYGFGWRIEHKGGEEWRNHSGLLQGYAAIIGALPKRDVKIILLSNATSTDLESENPFQGKAQFVDGEIIENVIAILQNKKPKFLPIKEESNHQKIADFSKTYELDNDHKLLLTKKGTQYALSTDNNSWSIFTYPFSKNLKEKNSSFTIASFFANAWSTQNFEGISKHATKEMNGLFDTEKGVKQLNEIWASFIKDLGAFKSYNIFKVEGNKSKTVHIRFHFEKNDIGIVLGINSKDQIQGMFKDTTVKTSHVRKVILIPVGKDIFFINGFQKNGMQDLYIKVSETALTVIDNGLIFKATRSANTKK
jgi:CubicO group peptidase (beta-lactamase class C family)